MYKDDKHRISKCLSLGVTSCPQEYYINRTLNEYRQMRR